MPRFFCRLSRPLAALLATCVMTAAWTQELPTPGTVQEQFKDRSPVPVRPGAPSLETPSTASPGSVAPGGRTILIERFEVSGNTVIDDATVAAVVQPFEGRSLTLFEIYEVADALTALYRERGYSVATVTVPAQKVSSGVVLLEVVEGRIGSVSVDGNTIYRDQYLENYTQSIQAGDVISQRGLERELLLLNDLPGLSAKAVVKPGEDFGDSNLILQVEDDRFEYAARFNNYGRTSIGEWKVEGDIAINSPLGIGDRIDLGIVHAEGGMLDYFSGRYSIPILYRGTRASLYFSRFDYEVDSDELPLGFQGLDLSGDGDNFGVNIFHPLIRSRYQNLFVGVGFDRTITRQLTRSLGLKDKTDIGLMVLSAIYSRVNQNNSFTTLSGVFSTNFNENERDPVTFRPEK